MRRVHRLPENDDIIHTGNTKLLFIEQLQMARANVQLLCHFTDSSCKLWIIGDLSAQGRQFMT